MNKSGQLSSNELNALASDIIRLSRLLTSEREGLPAAYLRDTGLRKAYRSYFLPSNLLKIHTPLKELLLHPWNVFSKNTLRVLDIGAGPGTASLGVVEFFSRSNKGPVLEMTAVDQLMENLKEAEDLFALSRHITGIAASLKTVQSDLERMKHRVQGTFDIIILSNVLNELFAKEGNRITKRLALMTDIMTRLLADNGSCIIIEPALRETSREMLEVREGLLHQGFTIYAPCLNNMNCLALLNPKDWCHEEIPWDPPELIKELDKLTGLRKDSLKFSYLVFRKDGATLSDACGKDAFRVVSEPLISKGKKEFYICGTGGRKLITRQDKDASESNAIFQDMKRGNVITFEQLMDEGKRYKVGKDTKITYAFSGPSLAEK